MSKYSSRQKQLLRGEAMFIRGVQHSNRSAGESSRSDTRLLVTALPTVQGGGA